MIGWLGQMSNHIGGVFYNVQFGQVHGRAVGRGLFPGSLYLRVYRGSVERY